MPAHRSPLPPCATPPVRPRASGWLFLLCCMLVVAGPLLTVALLALQWQALLARSALSGWLVGAALLSATLTGFALLRGMGAGRQLWRMRPGAAQSAKSALLLGLAAEVVDTLVGVAMAATPAHRVIGTAVLQALPGLAFFVLAFGYLQHSAEVQARFSAHAPA